MGWAGVIHYGNRRLRCAGVKVKRVLGSAWALCAPATHRRRACGRTSSPTSTRPTSGRSATRCPERCTPTAGCTARTAPSIARSHVPTKDRLRPMSGSQSIRTGQRAIEGAVPIRTVWWGHVVAMTLNVARQRPARRRPTGVRREHYLRSTCHHASQFTRASQSRPYALSSPAAGARFSPTNHPANPDRRIIAPLPHTQPLKPTPKPISTDDTPKHTGEAYRGSRCRLSAGRSSTGLVPTPTG